MVTFEISDDCGGMYTDQMCAIPVAGATILPRDTAVNNGPICIGDLLTLNEIGGDAVSWLWSTSGLGTISNTMIQSPTVSGVVNGDKFFVEVTDVNGCTNIDSTVATVITINPPDSIGIVLACPGDSSLLMVSVDSTETADWFDANGDTLVMGDTSFLATIAGSYFVITRDTVTGCESDTLEMVFDFHPLPSIQYLSDTCDATFSTYSFLFVTDGMDMVTVDTGLVAMIGVDTFEVTAIPIGDSVAVSILDTLTGCVFDTLITPPMCMCPTIAVNLTTGDTTLCAMDSIPAFEVVAGVNQIACWLDAAVDTIVATGDTSYIPTVAGTYSVFLKDTITNCVSDTVDVSLIINPLPVLTFTDTTCNATLDSFSVTINLGANRNDSIMVSIGTLTPVSNVITNTNYTITGIPNDSTLTVTVLDTITGCMITQIIDHNCDCLIPIIAPVAAIDTFRVCPMDSIGMTVSVDSTETADWFSAAGDTLVLGDTSYVTNVPGT